MASGRRPPVRGRPLLAGRRWHARPAALNDGLPRADQGLVTDVALSDGDGRQRRTPPRLAEALTDAAQAGWPVCSQCGQRAPEEEFHRYLFDFDGFAYDPRDYPDPKHLEQFGEGECNACWEHAERYGRPLWDATCVRCENAWGYPHCNVCGGRCE